MIDIRNFFAPSIGPPGLKIFVSSGIVLVSGTGVFVPAQLVSLSANTTSSVYLNTALASIQVSTSGFPTTNCYPIATIITGVSSISSMVDVRPDIGGTGSGGGGADDFLAVSSNQVLSVGTNDLYVDATAGVGGITLTLPTAATLQGQKVQIVMVDTGAGGVTINTTSAQTINGATSYVLTNQWQAVTMESNGANWRVLASAG